MTRPAELLNELLEIVRDGERFYLDAAARIDDPELKARFREMAELRQHLLDDLATNVEIRGSVPSDRRTLWGTMREAYAKVLAAIRPDDEEIYTDELQAAEERLLQHYQRALDEAPSKHVREVLERHLLTIRAAHETMTALKQGRAQKTD